MRVTPVSFREFNESAVETPVKVKPTFLPGGRFSGEDPPPPPTFSEAEVKAAEREGYKKGFLEGSEEGRRQQSDAQDEVKKQLAAALVNFTQHVEPILHDYRQMAIQMRKDVPQVALAIARKVAGQALSENAAASVEEIATRCISTMIMEPKLTVTVHESLGDALEQQLKNIAKKLQAAGDIVVIRDASIPLTDCRVEWKQGAFARNTEQLWKEIEQAIGNLGASAEYDTTEQMEKLEETVNAPKEPVDISADAAPEETPPAATPASESPSSPDEPTEPQPSQKE